MIGQGNDRKIAGIVIIIIALLVLIPADAVYAADFDPASYQENKNPYIIEDHYLGELKIINLKLCWDADRYSVTCQIINMGDEIFSDGIDLIFYDSWGQELHVLSRFFGISFEEIAPGEVKTVSTGIVFDNAEWPSKASEVRFRLSGTEERVTRSGVTKNRIIENVVVMEEISLCLDRMSFGRWQLQCYLSLADLDSSYIMPTHFEVYLTFMDRSRKIIIEDTIPLLSNRLKTGTMQYRTYNEDLSEAYYLEVKTNLPAYRPSEKPESPSGGSNTGSSQEAASKLVLTVLSGSKTKQAKKMKKPTIHISCKKYKKNIWMAKIRLKKYQGTHIEIYYRRGKGSFHKIKLKQSNIKKNKCVFKVGYKKGRKPIFIRIRTYKKKKRTKSYSAYSSIFRLKSQ